VVGVGNDFDNALSRTPGAGQHLVNQFLTPAGDTSWVQLQNSPTAASGTGVSITDTAPTGDRYDLSICEVLPGSGGGGTATPPTVSLVAPVYGGTVDALSTLWANASDAHGITGVQFLLDGAVMGSEVTTAPYTMTWNMASVSSGAHILAARAFNTAGLSSTSGPVSVTVDNSGNPAVVGSWSSPVALPAVAVNLILLKNGNVLFLSGWLFPDGLELRHGHLYSRPDKPKPFLLRARPPFRWKGACGGRLWGQRQRHRCSQRRDI
jgi:Bacterial Ig domain